MCHIVVDPQGNKVAEYPDEQWRAAYEAAGRCFGRVRTEGKFDEGRQQ